MKLRTQLLSGYLIVLLFVLGLTALAYKGVLSLLDTAAWVDHTHEVIGTARWLEKLVVDMETGERGFLIAGSDTFLEPYNRGIEEYDVALKELQLLIADNPAQIVRLENIDALVHQWRTVAAEPEIAERRKVSAEAIDADHLQALLSAGVGKRILDLLRAEVGRIDAFVAGQAGQATRFLALSFLKDVVDMETGQRGFLVTGQETFLEPYAAGEVAAQGHLAELRAIVEANYAGSDAVGMVSRLGSLHERWRREAGEPEIAARRRMNLTETSIKEVAALIESGTGKVIMDRFRSRVGEFVDVEERLLITRQDESATAVSASLLATFLGAAVTIGVGVTLMFFILRNVLAMVGGEPAAIAKITERVAAGDLDIAFPQNAELTGILASVESMVTSLREKASAAEAIAGGDLNLEIVPRSHRDTLGIALQVMTRNLKEAKEAAESGALAKSEFLANMSHVAA